MRSKHHSASRNFVYLDDLISLASSVFYVFKALNKYLREYGNSCHTICNTVVLFRSHEVDDFVNKLSQFRRNQRHWLLAALHTYTGRCVSSACPAPHSTVSLCSSLPCSLLPAPRFTVALRLLCLLASFGFSQWGHWKEIEGEQGRESGRFLP